MENNIMLFSIFILTVLWIVSLFSFARYRHNLAAVKGDPGNPNADWAFQLYLKLSGAVILWSVLALTS